MAKTPKGSKIHLTSRIVMILVFLAGLLVMAYPFYIDALNGLIDQRRVSRLQETTQQKYQKEQKAHMKARNKEIKKNGLIPSVDPFTDNNEKKISDEKKINEHLIGAISLPSIQVTLPLFDQTTPSLLQEGATVLQGTSFPLGGKDTHTVISAHSGLPEKQLFTNLEEVKKGDIFVLTVFDEKLAYQVDKIEVVEPSNTAVLKIEAGRDIATLMTCTPYGINSHRLLVTGFRVPYTEKIAEQERQAEQAAQIKRLLILLGLSVGVLLLLFGIYRAIYLYQLKKQRFDLVLLRKDSSGTRLSGIAYGLYTTSGKRPVIRDNIALVKTSDERGLTVFENLPGGVYYVKEANSTLMFKAGIKKVKQKEPRFYAKKEQEFLSIVDGKIMIKK